MKKIMQFIAFTILLCIHGWVLIFKIPHTLRSLFSVFHPAAHNTADNNLWAFGPQDAGFRPWYNKIARDYHTQGRFGYAWEDGLGIPLGVRIYNNFVTYKLLHWLGTHRMMAIGYFLMVLTSALLSGWGFTLWVGILAGILVSGSPLIISSYTHLGKPEVLWWPAALIVAVAVFSKQVLLAGILWSLLAFVNLPVSIMLALILGPGLIYTGNLGSLFIGAMPGIIKHGIRGIYMWRSGFFRTFMSEQAHSLKCPWRPVLDELIWWVPFTVSIVASIQASQQFNVGLLLSALIMGLGLHWVNHRIIHLNDDQSFYLAFFVIGLSSVIMAKSLIGLTAILVLAYTHPSFCGIPCENEKTSNYNNPRQRQFFNAWLQIKNYPALASITLPKPGSLMEFFDQIPDKARILVESDGDPRIGSKFRNFWQWTEEFLPDRQVDLVNEIYARLVEPDLTDNYLVRFNAEQMPADEMDQLCNVLGVSYVIAYTLSTVEVLQKIGYKLIAQVDLGTLKQFRTIINTPAVILFLLQNPFPVTIIDPPTTWIRKGNMLSWQAEAGQTYTVRYRYYPEFDASQNGQTLKIEATHPIPGISLAFMRVCAIRSGPIVLTFHPRFF